MTNIAATSGGAFLPDDGDATSVRLCTSPVLQLPTSNFQPTSYVEHGHVRDGSEGLTCPNAPPVQVYQAWQRRQTDRAAAAAASASGQAQDSHTHQTAAAKVPGVTDAFYAKLTLALEVSNISPHAFRSTSVGVIVT